MRDVSKRIAVAATRAKAGDLDPVVLFRDISSFAKPRAELRVTVMGGVMGDVSVRILHFLHEIARCANVDEDALFDGFRAFAPRRRTPSWIDWDPFAILWERLEIAAGGPEGFKTAACLAVPIAMPEFAAFATVFTNPIALYRFMMVRHMRTLFRNIEVVEIEQTESGRVRVGETIPAPNRPCPAYHRASRTFASLIPVPLGFPEATITCKQVTERAAEFDAQYPVPRARVRGAAVRDRVAAQLDEAYALAGDRLRAQPLLEPAMAADVEPPLWVNALDLSERQRAVFELVVKGHANKHIATVLACTERNVEFHVGRILRAARVTSRAELLVKVLRGPSARETRDT